MKITQLTVEKDKHKAPPRQFWPDPPIPDPDPDDDAINDERQWKACPIFE